MSGFKKAREDERHQGWVRCQQLKNRLVVKKKEEEERAVLAWRHVRISGPLSASGLKQDLRRTNLSFSAVCTPFMVDVKRKFMYGYQYNIIPPQSFWAPAWRTPNSSLFFLRLPWGVGDERWGFSERLLCVYYVRLPGIRYPQSLAWSRSPEAKKSQQPKSVSRQREFADSPPTPK